MAFVVAHAEKYSSGACAGLGIHVDRKSKEHSNKNIDNALSSENVELVENYNNNLYGAVKDRIREGYTGKKAIRKDAVATVGVVCSASSDFFENKSKSESIQYFKDCKEFFENKIGKENIVCAKIHFDEKTPHMHLYFVPLTADGRLSAKEICNREFLRDMQRELPLYLQEKGHNVERGLEDSTNEHISKKEYEINLQQIELDRKILLLLEKEKELEEKKEKLKYEKEKLYKIDDILEHVKEKKKFLSDEVSVSVDKELFKSLICYARDSEKFFKELVKLEKKQENFSSELSKIVKEKEEIITKNEELENEIKSLIFKNMKLEKENKDLEKETKKYFNYYQQAVKMENRYRKIIDKSPEATELLKQDIKKVRGMER